MSSMAAAEGNTRDGSAPKIQATSMHRVGLTRLPPASMEYLMAPSSPSSLVSSVNLLAAEMAKLWADNAEKDGPQLLAEGMRRVCARLEGAFTLLAVDVQVPDAVVGARRNSPLVVG